MVGNRGARAALALTDDLAPRLANRVQVTSDGHKAYLDAVDMSFGGEVDYAMLVKIFGETPNAGPGRKYSPPECVGTRKQRISGNPDTKHVSTSYAERNNLNIRMHSRRMTRLGPVRLRRSVAGGVAS